MRVPTSVASSGCDRHSPELASLRLMIQEFEKKSAKGTLPELRSGYTVRVSQKIREGDKERIQTFEGLIIKLNPGYGPNRTITVRKIIDGIGVEKIYPVYSPNIAKIEVVKKSKVRKAKLYYMRGKLGEHFKLYEDKKEEKVKAKNARA